jgi:hypothetical protein
VNETFDDEDRAIARALGTDADATGPVDERALDDYREVLAHMPFDERTPPADLEERVLAAAVARRAPAKVVAALEARRSRRTAARWTVVGASLAAAAAVVAFLLASGGGSDPAPKARMELANSTRATVDAVLATPGVRQGTLVDTGSVALAPDGRGVVYDLADGTYTIDLIADGGVATLGPVDARGGVIAFDVDHPERVEVVTVRSGGRLLATAQLTKG